MKSRAAPGVCGVPIQSNLDTANVSRITIVVYFYRFLLDVIILSSCLPGSCETASSHWQ